jgi:hypothetical protein
VAFGRKKRKDEELGEEVETAVDETPVADAAPAADAGPATTGPFDEADADEETPRVDLGGVRVPVPEGAEVRVDVNPEGHVVSAVVVHGASQMQVNAFAAPRREGIWDEVRTEIMNSLRNEQGGVADEADGPFGRELRGRIPAGQPGQTTTARFLGADGPRWFLRGLITGPASTDPVQAKVLEDVFRGIVVVRGNDAMAPRDAIPLRLPREAAEHHAEAQRQAAEQAQQSTSDDFNPFERGPEITETR